MKGGPMIGESWFSDPVAAGWLVIASLGLLLLLVLATRANGHPLGERHDVTFTGSEPDAPEDEEEDEEPGPGQRLPGAPFVRNAEEVEDADRRTPLP